MASYVRLAPTQHDVSSLLHESAAGSSDRVPEHEAMKLRVTVSRLRQGRTSTLCETVDHRHSQCVALRLQYVSRTFASMLQLTHSAGRKPVEWGIALNPGCFQLRSTFMIIASLRQIQEAVVRARDTDCD